MVSLVNRTGNGGWVKRVMIFIGRIVLSGIHGQGNPIERFWGVKRELNCFQSGYGGFKKLA
jgi:hypothetical protein